MQVPKGRWPSGFSMNLKGMMKKLSENLHSAGLERTLEVIPPHSVVTDYLHRENVK